ncbi:Stp1/IreP family PP2C-type Ser/Thr phosphatase [Tissierella creatinini]|nr:Stp1/IreP family PP2C-type Ser/Thr phosphatase [Tissierella creatinini]TJX69199.1 Stp1/IreP family PP2C-type Ser/Thr phosphatase [Soehngenia saccharolytica]
MIVGAVSDIGLRRENNQDSMFASTDLDFPIFIVADGMGGHNAGDIASSMAVKGMVRFLDENRNRLKEENEIKKCIKEAIAYVNDEIFLKSIESSELKGMGTTLTIIFIDNKKFYIGHVGDSRTYLIRDDKIIQITEDHTLINELIKEGSITTAEAINHPQRNMITRAVGTSCNIKSDIYIQDIKPKDIIILCSDGLTNMIDEKIILRVLERYDRRDMKNICNILVKLAKENGGNDNITVIGINMDNEVLI